MKSWVKCCQCGEQTKYDGLDLSTSTCKCGCCRFKVQMGGKTPDWWADDVNQAEDKEDK